MPFGIAGALDVTPICCLSGSRLQSCLFSKCSIEAVKNMQRSFRYTGKKMDASQILCTN